MAMMMTEKDNRMGRFISEDPIGLLGGVNYFAYVGNSPCNFTDPLGLGPLETFFTAIGILDPGGTGAAAGSTVGAAAGGIVGGIFFNVPGAIVGGTIGYLGGRYLGGLFDPEGAGQLNYGEQHRLAVIQAGVEGAMYTDRVINETKQLTEEIHELNGWMRDQRQDKECPSK